MNVVWGGWTSVNQKNSGLHWNDKETLSAESSTTQSMLLFPSPSREQRRTVQIDVRAMPLPSPFSFHPTHRKDALLFSHSLIDFRNERRMSSFLLKMFIWQRKVANRFRFVRRTGENDGKVECLKVRAERINWRVLQLSFECLGFFCRSWVDAVLSFELTSSNQRENSLRFEDKSERKSSCAAFCPTSEIWLLKSSVCFHRFVKSKENQPRIQSIGVGEAKQQKNCFSLSWFSSVKQKANSFVFLSEFISMTNVLFLWQFNWKDFCWIRSNKIDGDLLFIEEKRPKNDQRKKFSRPPKKIRCSNQFEIVVENDEADWFIVEGKSIDLDANKICKWQRRIFSSDCRYYDDENSRQRQAIEVIPFICKERKYLNLLNRRSSICLLVTVLALISMVIGSILVSILLHQRNSSRRSLFERNFHLQSSDFSRVCHSNDSFSEKLLSFQSVFIFRLICKIVLFDLEPISLNISTASKFSTSCRVDKNYIIRKSSNNWTRISNFLEGVFPSPQNLLFKIDFPAEIARIFRFLSTIDLFFFWLFLSALDKDKRIRPCIYITSTAETKERENHLNWLVTIKAA